jgi:LuxR family maltose regulon positive regulatory protein
MWRLLARLAARGSVEDPFLDRLMRSFPGEHEPPVSLPRRPRGRVPALAEALTWREVEVLKLLGERLSNKEIAERLVISPLTVKRHTIELYRKLEVTGRRGAVARAAELGLFESGNQIGAAS